MESRTVFGFRGALAASVVGVGVVGAAAGQEAVELAWKWEAGQTDRYRIRTDIDMDMGQFGGMTQKQTFVYRQEVREVAEDGAATLAWVYESMRVEMESPFLDPMVYDSAEPAGGDDEVREVFGKLFGSLLEARVTAVVEPTGRVRSVEGMDAVLDAMAAVDEPELAAMAAMFREGMGDEAMKSMLEGWMRVVPGRAVEVGESWKSSVGVKMQPIGRMATKSTYTLEGFEDRGGERCARLKLAGAMEIEEAGDGGMGLEEVSITESAMSGSVLFGVERGRLVGMEMDSTTVIDMSFAAMGERMQIRQTVKMRMSMDLLEGGGQG